MERAHFEQLSQIAFDSLKKDEHLFITLAGEQSQFIRVNGARVRQSGTIEDTELTLNLLHSTEGDLRKGERTFTITGELHLDRETLMRELEILSAEVPSLPTDPFAQLPKDTGSSVSDQKGDLLAPENAIDALLPALQNTDVVGIYASGTSVRAMSNSAGQSHWFSTENFSFDYSMYTPSQRALKATYAGRSFDPKAYQHQLEGSRAQLPVLGRPARRIPRGEYRTYLAPAAVSDLIGMLSWGGVSEASIRQGDSPLRHMRSGERALSSKFSLIEDFSGGEVPRFNSEGELAPLQLALISEGKLAGSLVSSRTSKEYGVVSNGANAWETLRSPSVAAGSLRENEILKKLGEGLYLNNLHYLSWSDQAGGRITGMTRYACFWVENGEIVAPIENLRWDDSLFSLLGSELLECTLERAYEPSVMTYGMRQLGGAWLPGMLISKMKFTL
jgi:predicted Zn-dependent protease